MIITSMVMRPGDYAGRFRHGFNDALRSHGWNDSLMKTNFAILAAAMFETVSTAQSF
jgi:hypothetical protein